MKDNIEKPIELHRFIIEISGIVQGVGLRPFIYNLAKNMDIKGVVQNTPQGVLIDIECGNDILKDFMDNLKSSLPPIARINEINIRKGSFIRYTDFLIADSFQTNQKFTLISPDIAICRDCLHELEEVNDRRYRYPFINCTNCGPRFSIIKDIPYDRVKTTMVEFDLCDECLYEYFNPMDRRFHAQPNACAKCGPRLYLKDSKGQDIGDTKIIESAKRNNAIISLAVNLLKEGKILAVKGLGGYHLSCDGKNNDAVARLRRRKVREDKPFAVMAKNLKVLSEQVFINEKEEEVLTGYKKPIILLRKKPKYNLAEEIAPRNNFLGVMLPYTPLHQLLLNINPDIDILVMTSGNRSNEPIVYQDDEAQKVLSDIADYFLIHNRIIHRRVDDSVTRVWRGKEYVLRRSRGYAPSPIIINHPIKKNILACGGEQKSVFCLNQGQHFFLSHHIGDLENSETLMAFEAGIKDFQKLFNISPEIVAYDLHPDYLSTNYAQEMDLLRVPVQHHHAHVVSCMVENGLTERVLGVVFDGTGFGTDQNLWGGEFLIADLRDFYRYAHLRYLPMPGGAKAIKEPWRMAVAYLLDTFGEDFILNKKLSFLKDIDSGNLRLLIEGTIKGINAPLTSSVGRLFDGAAALLNLRTIANYEGQGAIEFEQLAYNISYKHQGALKEIKLLPYHWQLNKGIIDIRQLIQGIVGDIQRGRAREEVAYRFHITIADVVVKLAKDVRRKTGINKVCLSGGVFQNMLLLDLAFNKLMDEDFKVYVHSEVPVNDGGIALGQGVIAYERGSR